MDLESTARELKMLAGRERLAPSELDRARDLMVDLKRLGMSNPEIVELTAGRWSEPTLKGYTRGVKATDPEPWKSTAALLSEMVSRDLTLAEVSQGMTVTTELQAMQSPLADVVSFMQDLKAKETSLGQLREAMNISTELEAKGTSPGEIAGFLHQLEQENIDAPSFVLLLRDWLEAGLTPADAHSALNYREQLEGAGFDIKALAQVDEAAGKFGSPAEVLEVVAVYGNLVKLDEEVKTRRVKLDEEVEIKRGELDKELKTRRGELEKELQTKQKELDQEAQTKRQELEALAAEMETRSQELDAAGQKLDAAGQKLEEVQNQTAAAEKALATYGRLEATGFDEKALAELAKATEKYGGPRKVLAAVNSFGDLSGIKAASEEAQGKLQQQKAALKDVEGKHSHLKSAIEMCQKLLRDYKFGLDAITAILAMAKMYGEPVKVLKAVESYGKRRAMDEEARQLEARIEQLKKTESQYEARSKAILDQLEALNAKSIEVGRTVGAVQEQVKRDTLARDLGNLLQNPTSAGYEAYLPLALVMLNSMSVWANMNKSRFAYFSLLDRNLKEAMGNIGGG